MPQVVKALFVKSVQINLIVLGVPPHGDGPHIVIVEAIANLLQLCFVVVDFV